MSFKFIRVAFKDVLLFTRDRQALMLLIAMPIILILILGIALGPVFSGVSEISKTQLAIVDKDRGQVSRALIDDVFGSPKLKEIIELKSFGESEAKDLVRKGELTVLLIIPSGFSFRIESGLSSHLDIYADPNQPIRAGIVRGIISSFANQVGGIQIMVKTALGELIDRRVVSPRDLPAVTPALIAAARAEAEKDLVAIKEETAAARKTVNAFQYYAAGMGVMFLLFAAMAGAQSILRERESQTLARLFTTPTDKASILAGKLIGTFLIAFLQFSLVIIFTSLVYRVHWGNSLLGIVMISVATVFAATGVAVFIAAISRTVATANVLEQFFVMSMSLIGGSMFPIMAMPPWIKTLSKATVNGWAMATYSQLMTDASYHVAVVPSLALLGYGLLFFVVGVWRLKF
jgi:ABC-2 type transport system permease protein